MSQNGPGGPPGSGNPMDVQMIKPQHIAAIPILSDTDKQKYQNGLEKLWNTANNNPPDSEMHQKAIAKIKEVSKDLMHRLARSKTNQRAQMAAAQGGQQQKQAQNQQAAQFQNAQPVSQRQQPVQMQQPQNQAMAQAQAQAQAMQQQRPPQQPGQQAARLTSSAEEFLRKFEVYPPPNIMPQTPDHAQHKAKMIGILQKCLAASERYGGMIREYQEREKAGHTPSPEQVNQNMQVKQALQKAKSEFERVKTENDRNKNYWAVRRTQNAAAGEANQAQMRAPNQQDMALTSQGNPSQQQQQQQLPQQQSQQMAQQQTRPQPVPQQYPPGQQGPPQSLSHQAAISAINRTYSDAMPPQVAAPISRQGTGTGTPTSAGQAPPSAGAFNAAQPTPPTVGSTIGTAKMPIPQKLDTPPVQPVQMAPARPTLGAGPQGLLGQPGLQKPPGFTLEGEEGRVLSKRKLDELVSQVTGGGEGLSPEAEEALLEEADEFVDTVLTQACRLAKIRPNATLDIRDIQVVLERNFNIRIPGYSLDEVRTVRKFQPAPGWTQKMNAVQAAKVMGKGDN